MYEQQAGGAISVTSTLFQLLNGFSNSFYGKLSDMNSECFPHDCYTTLPELFRFTINNAESIFCSEGLRDSLFRLPTI